MPITNGDHAANSDDATSSSIVAPSKLTLDGTQAFCAGLSPAYWAHVPLSVAQLHALHLINGLHCLKANHNTWQPLTKCRVTGTVVSVDRKANFVSYVVDDGTGLVDCVQWNDDHDDGFGALEEIMYGNSTPEEGVLAVVGDVVRVFGRIEAVGIEPDHHPSQRQPHVVRELHVVRMDRLSQDTVYGNQTHDAEASDWLDAINAPANLQHHPLNVLHQLGPAITQQVLDGTDLPSLDERAATWRVYGPACRCNVPYQDELLYCHCIATALEMAGLDNALTFRDALLRTLLAMERVAMADEPLCFGYKTVAQDELLLQTACTVCGHCTTARDPVVERLFLATFRALRQDGIVYLLDASSDTYLLISRARVLEPYVQVRHGQDWPDRVARADLLRRQFRPAYLAQVPRAKLQYLQKELLGDKGN